MPKPRKGETEDQFIQRCIPDLIENEGREQSQAIATCYSVWDNREKSKADAPNYRNSDTQNKCSNCDFARPGLWCELYNFKFDNGYTCDSWQQVASKEVEVENEISIDVKLEGADEVEKQLDGLTEKAEKLNDAVEKSMHGDMEEKDEMVYMATSFGELEDMRETALRADIVREMSDVFAQLSKNIMANPMIEDKQEALSNLVGEFSERVGGAIEAKELEQQEDFTKEQLRYKEIDIDDTLAKDSDFKGGCSVCGFGEKDVMKSLSQCPFCHNEVSDG